MELNESNYFSHDAEAFYMGSTQYKRFRACEAAALAVLRGEWREEPSTAMLVGSYVDAHFSGTLDLFRAKHPEIYKRDGSLKAEYEHANAIIARVERDEAFMAAVTGPKQVIMTGEIEGVPVKIKIDCPQPNMTVDFKVMRDFADVYSKDDNAWNPWWRAWGYDIQGAIYREIRRQNDGQLLPFGLAAVTKEKPEPDLALLELPESALDEALEVVRQDIAYYDALKKGAIDMPPTRCGKCAYCRATKVLAGWEVPEC